ncbi:hypothetical protein FA95DRAFT_121463 [Auriscalpium vulgare]|uniref:Uncharacterized protein n=1 Tax=Auriscalpium vulgare TaxID=40419 RepID=A0ACB8RN60_9AGAM|nr:hypothetical protein FA95DRAFT_121463 [Auriscalpium vulgare]
MKSKYPSIHQQCDIHLLKRSEHRPAAAPGPQLVPSVCGGPQNASATDVNASAAYRITICARLRRWGPASSRVCAPDVRRGRLHGGASGARRTRALFSGVGVASQPGRGDSWRVRNGMSALCPQAQPLCRSRNATWAG